MSKQMPSPHTVVGRDVATIRSEMEGECNALVPVTNEE